MKRNIKILILTLLIFIFAGMDTTFAKTMKVVLPQPVISHIGTSYLKGERPYINITATGYTKSVQYRVLLINDKTKKKTEILKAYSKNYSSKTLVGVTLPALDSGNYTLTLYVRRSGTKVNYDKYTYKKFSVVNDLIISKANTTYGKVNVNKTVYGNVFINADNVSLNGVISKGTIYINPGKNGTTNLNNVQAAAIEVKSGGENSIHLNDVKTGNLNINTQSKTRVEINGSTNITNTEVQSDAILDASSGIFGNVIVNNTKDEESKIELRGEFKYPIIVRSKASLTTAQDAKVSKVQVETLKNDDNVTLNGVYDNVVINNEANIKLDALVSIMDINAKAIIEKTKAADIKTINKNNKDAEIKESGDNNGNESGSNSGNEVPPVTTPGNPPVVTPPEEDSAPEVNFAGVVVSSDPSHPIEMTKTGSNTYSIDLSKQDNSTSIISIVIEASKDCVLMPPYPAQHGVSISGGTRNTIKISDFGIPDGGTPGVSLSTIRITKHGSVDLPVELYYGSKEVNITLRIILD